MWLEKNDQDPVRLTLTAAEATALRTFLDEHAENVGDNAAALLEQIRHAEIEPEPQPKRIRYEFAPPRDLPD